MYPKYKHVLAVQHVIRVRWEVI